MPRIGAPPTAQKLISKTVFKRTIPSTQSTRHRDTLTTTTRRVRTLTHTSHDQPSLDIVEKEAYVLAEQHEPDHKEMRPTEVAQWHGHKPGRGAVIDEQLQAEDLEELKRKGRA